MALPEAGEQTWSLQRANVFMIHVCVLTLHPGQGGVAGGGRLSPCQGGLSTLGTTPLHTLKQSHALRSVNKRRKNCMHVWFLLAEGGCLQRHKSCGCV